MNLAEICCCSLSSNVLVDNKCDDRSKINYIKDKAKGKLHLEN